MRRACWIVGAVLMLSGCGSGGGEMPVNGVVTWDGAPLDAATVTFYPAEGTSAGTANTFGFARTGSDGKFVILGAKGQRGLAPGQYKVTVSKMKLPAAKEGSDADPAAVGAVTEADVKNDLPAIYSDPAQTVLAYSVTGDGKPIEIQLSSKRKK